MCVYTPKLAVVNTGRRQGGSWVTQVGDRPHWPAGGFLLPVCVAEVTGAASALGMPHCPQDMPLIHGRGPQDGLYRSLYLAEAPGVC